MAIPLRTIILPTEGKYSEQHRKMLESNLDSLFLRYIHLRDRGICVLTGKRQRNVEPFHFWKDCPALRWDERTIHDVVLSERDRFNNRDCTVYHDFMVRTYPEFEELKKLARQRECAYSIKKLLEITDTLGKKYQKLLIEKRDSK